MKVVSFSRHTAGAVRSTVLLLFASVLAYSSAVTVTPTVTSSAGLYTYAYSISYTGTDDLFLIDIPVATGDLAVTNIMSPMGFTWAYDSVNGLVSFLEDSGTFNAIPTSGFSFDSFIGPSSASFSGSVVDGSASISTIDGLTMAPTPEPSYFYLLAVMAPVMWFYKRRKTAKLTSMETLHV